MGSEDILPWGRGGKYLPISVGRGLDGWQLEGVAAALFLLPGSLWAGFVAVLFVSF